MFKQSGQAYGPGLVLRHHRQEFVQRKKPPRPPLNQATSGRPGFGSIACLQSGVACFTMQYSRDIITGIFSNVNA